MRLQLILFIVLTAFYQPTTGQSGNSSSSEVTTERRDNPSSITGIETNFLFGYYQQDGNHSAVTGGMGTEELKDHDFRFIINIPLDSIQSLRVNAGINYYTSASTDNIDTKVSSASREDVRSQFNLTYTRAHPVKGTSYSIGWGGSVESDYISTSFNASWEKIFNQGSSQLNFGFQAFFDNWVLIIPEELRVPNTDIPSTDRRRSYNMAATYQQVINSRLQASISGELIYQTGLLSTPFHRVYFQQQDTAKIEKLPGSRFKLPISLRLNYFLDDFAVLRSFFRYYHDDFGIDAITASIEPRVKFSTFFTLYPHYRYHFQTATDYFAPYRQHGLTETYYTSDYDLSRFDSHTFGLGLHWSPLSGIGRFHLFTKKRLTLFSSIDIRYSRYHRSDGLKSNLVGIDLGFNSFK